MPANAQWMDLTTQQLVRYEALFTLLDDIQALDDVGQVAQTRGHAVEVLCQRRRVAPGDAGNPAASC
jgi:hypothetical protein